jgi:hypothetical protein
MENAADLIRSEFLELRHPVQRAGASRGDALTRVRRRAPDRGPADGRPW